MDLKDQIDSLQPEITAALEKVCRSAAFSDGIFVDQFEKEFADFLGAANFAGLSSGSDALFLGLKALGIGPGDEVIVPANTFIATAFAPMRLGAVPVFADCDPLTWQIDPVSAEQKIGPKTRAVIGVHLYGQAFPVDELRQLTDAHGLKLLEDCAQAQGSLYRGRAAGTLSDAGCFSFYPSKNLGAYGQAGGICCADEQIDRVVRIMRSQGESRKYRHEMLGYNMRIDALQAVVLSAKLPHLSAWNERRAQIVRQYRDEIHNPALQFQAESELTKPAWYLAVVCVDDRDHFLAYMEDNNIHCGVHYPVPCHLQPAMKDLGYHPGDLPRAEYQTAHCVSLPLYPELPDQDAAYIIDVCNTYKKNK